MSNEEYFDKLTQEQNRIEKLYIDKIIDEFVYEFQMNNIKISREQKQRELLK